MIMSDYESVDYICTYQPCGHKESRTKYKYDFARWSDKAVDFCPKCHLFTLTPVNPFKALLTQGQQT